MRYKSVGTPHRHHHMLAWNDEAFKAQERPGYWHTLKYIENPSTSRQLLSKYRAGHHGITEFDNNDLEWRLRPVTEHGWPLQLRYVTSVNIPDLAPSYVDTHINYETYVRRQTSPVSRLICHTVGVRSKHWPWDRGVLITIPALERALILPEPVAAYLRLALNVALV